jgi:hypothetical protein
LNRLLCPPLSFFIKPKPLNTVFMEAGQYRGRSMLMMGWKGYPMAWQPRHSLNRVRDPTHRGKFRMRAPAPAAKIPGFSWCARKRPGFRWIYPWQT